MNTFSALVIPTAITVILTSGCASILGKSAYNVTVNSQPGQAEITIADKSGHSVYSGKTPATVSLNAGAGYFSGQDYTVKFKKSGYAEYSTTIERSVNPWYMGNLILGGLIGFLIVDPLTGAMWTLNENVNATLQPTTSMHNSGQAIRIVFLNDVPDHLRSQLMRIN